MRYAIVQKVYFSTFVRCILSLKCMDIFCSVSLSELTLELAPCQHDMETETESETETETENGTGTSTEIETETSA